MDTRRTPTSSLANVLAHIREHRDEVIKTWLQTLADAWGTEAGPKRRAVEIAIAAHSDLLSIALASLEAGGSVEEGGVSPFLRRTQGSGYSAGGLVLETRCLLESVQCVLGQAVVDGVPMPADTMHVLETAVWALVHGAIAETSEVLEQVIEEGVRGFCRLDGDGHIVYANGAMRRILGSAEPGARFESFFQGEEREFVRQSLAGAMITAPRLRRLQLTLPSGVAMPVGAEIGPLRVGGQRSGGYACLVDLSHAARSEREIADASPFGIFTVNLDAKLTYANRPALEVLGLDRWEGKTLYDLLPGAEAARVIQERLLRRQQGLSDEYELALTRPNDSQRVQVKFIARPETDLQGNIVGSRVQVHDLTEENARKAILLSLAGLNDAQELLVAMAGAVKPLIPFDLMTVSVYSRDLRFGRPFLTFLPGGKMSLEKRWWKVDAEMRQWADNRDVFTTGDLPAFLDQDLWRKLRSTDDVKKLLAQGFRSLMRLPVYTDRLLGSVSFLSKSPDAYGDRHKDILNRLPLDKVVLTSMHHEAEKDLRFRLDLIRTVATACKRVEEGAEAIATGLFRHYGWQIVVMLRVDEDARVFRMVSRAAAPGVDFPEQYEQPLNEGVLGYAYERGEPVNIGNVSTDEAFKGIYKSVVSGSKSELCIPIRCEGRVKWLLDIEDNREDAFSDDEVAALKEVLDEFGVVLAQIWLAHVLEETLQSTSDAIFVTANNGTIRSANRAARDLLNVGDTPIEGSPIQERFADPHQAEAVLRARRFPGSEVELRRAGGAAVAVLLSGAALPEDVGGRVFVARDLSLHRRVEELQRLQMLYHRIALQTKTPLSLAFTWLRRAQRECPEDPVRDLVTKSLAQLRKAEITYDRLALYDREEGELPYRELLLDFPAEVVEKVVREFPKGDQENISLKVQMRPLYVRGDLYQLSFCFGTMLSYLLRFVPETGRVSVRVGLLGSKRLLSVIEGPVPEQLDAQASQASAEMMLGEQTLRAFLARSGGSYERATRNGTLTFRIELPLAEESVQ